MLLRNIELSNLLTIGEGKDITIDGQSQYTISRGTDISTNDSSIYTGGFFSVAKGAVLKLINVTLDGGTITLYAQWAIDKHTVTYTDGVDGEEVFSDQTTEADYNSGTPAFSGTPAREGYTFLGWEPEVADTVTGNVVYVAQWKKAENPVVEPSNETPAGKAEEEQNKSGSTETEEEQNKAGSSETEEKKDNNSLNSESESSEKTGTAAAAVTTSTADAPKTGDAGALPWLLSMLGSGGGLCGLFESRRKRRKK